MKEKKVPQPASLVDQRNEVADLIELAHLAAGAGDFCAESWLSRFAKHLERHGRLSPRQLEIIAGARERYEGDLADLWLRRGLARHA